MALAATHVRFALEFKDTLGISDVKKYLSGTLYPDSRYLTGLDRATTHFKNTYDSAFGAHDDFKQGWMMHVLCDNVQWVVTKEKFPEIFVGTTEQGGEAWVKHTALKMLQDIHDAQSFDVKQCIEGACAYVLAANGEDPEKLKHYYKITCDMYRDPAHLTMHDALAWGSGLGMGDTLVAAIASQATLYQNDTRVKKFLEEIYPAMVEKARQVLCA